MSCQAESARFTLGHPDIIITIIKTIIIIILMIITRQSCIRRLPWHNSNNNHAKVCLPPLTDGDRAVFDCFVSSLR